MEATTKNDDVKLNTTERTPSYGEMLLLVNAVGGELFGVKQVRILAKTGAPPPSPMYSALSIGLALLDREVIEGTGATPEAAIRALAAACRERLELRMVEMRAALGQGA